MQLAIHAAEYLKLKNSTVEVTVRDLEGDVETVVVASGRAAHIE